MTNKPARKPAAAAEPPEPPQVPTQIRIGVVQAVGVPLLALLPAVALTGLLGEREDHVRSLSTGGISLQVDYPAVLRFRTMRELGITVRNEGETTVPMATLQIDQSYLGAFTRVQTTPAVEGVTPDHHEVPLGPLPPGEARRVVATLEGDKYGRHAGRVRLAAQPGSDVAVDIATVVLP
jgi:hypothetical protein